MANLRKQDYFDLAGMIEEFKDRCMCIYCGEPATDKEHVIPRTWGGVYMVPSCRECNAVAGPKLFGSLSEKRTYIETRIRKKYARLIKTLEWDRDELKQLGKNLRIAVEASEAARKIIIQRLEFMRVAREPKS